MIETAGTLGNRASVSIPSVPIELPLVSEKDEEDIIACARDKIDYIILTGIRTTDNVMKYKEIIGW